MLTKFCFESLKEGGHSEDVGVDVRIILSGSQGNRIWGCGLDSSGSGQGLVARSSMNLWDP
jgi:hypothetical protein